MSQVFPQNIKSKIEKKSGHSDCYQLEVTYNEKTFGTEININEFKSKIIEIDQIADLINENNVNPNLKYKIEYKLSNVNNANVLFILMKTSLKVENLKKINDFTHLILIETTNKKYSDLHQQKGNFVSDEKNKIIIISYGITGSLSWLDLNNKLNLINKNSDTCGAGKILSYPVKNELKTKTDLIQHVMNYINENHNISKIMIMNEKFHEHRIILNVQPQSKNKRISSINFVKIEELFKLTMKYEILDIFKDNLCIVKCYNNNK